MGISTQNVLFSNSCHPVAYERKTVFLLNKLATVDESQIRKNLELFYTLMQSEILRICHSSTYISTVEPYGIALYGNHTLLSAKIPYLVVR